MKKLFFAVLTSFFLITMTAYAQQEIILEYSFMNAPLPESIYETGEITQTDEEFPVLFSSRQTVDEIIYQSFDVLSPENIENATISHNNYGIYYADVSIPLYFLRDDSVGTLREQMEIILEGIHEIYARYLSDNPEYFYLIPRNYGGTGTVNERYIIVTFQPVICYGFPDFDASKEDLKELKTKYDNLMAVIGNVAQELMFDGMTDLDKLLLAHDYIIDNNAYYLVQTKAEDNGEVEITNYYGDGYSYNAYGILVNQKGVCQGLSYAYPALLKAMGYPIENIRQIRSEELQHMWNFVKLGDNWYHVDLTWDDPTVIRQTGDLYDMNDESLQYEYHNYFLISDEQNTKLRNSKGYNNFVLEILGYDDNDHILADDNSYESGYIFNDPVNSGNIKVPGKVEYENGYYKKYYANEGVYFNYDTIEAPLYAVSQLYNNNTKFIFLGASSRTVSNLKATLYICYYDENGRFIEAKMDDKTFCSFGINTITINKPKDAKQIKIITVNKGTVIPIANVPIIK